jgi:hypothetical protein
MRVGCPHRGPRACALTYGSPHVLSVVRKMRLATGPNATRAPPRSSGRGPRTGSQRGLLSPHVVRMILLSPHSVRRNTDQDGHLRSLEVYLKPQVRGLETGYSQARRPRPPRCRRSWRPGSVTSGDVLGPPLTCGDGLSSPVTISRLLSLPCGHDVASEVAGCACAAASTVPVPLLRLSRVRRGAGVLRHLRRLRMGGRPVPAPLRDSRRRQCPSD